MFHMHAYLVRAAGFQLALNDGHISQPLQYLVMRDRIFSVFSIGIGIEYFAKTLVPADVGAHSAGVVGHIAPDQCDIMAMNGMIEKEKDLKEEVLILEKTTYF